MTPQFPNTTQIRVYTCVLNQTGTAAPVATILHNTLGQQEVIIWTRVSTGSYRGSLTEDLDPAKCAIFIQNPAIISHAGAGISGGNIYIENNNIAAPNANVDVLAAISFELRIYNI